MSPGPVKPMLDMGAAFDENFDFVWSTLRRFGVRKADLEDLVQEVFLKIYVRRADYDATRPLRPWLFGFAYRVAADYRRQARHHAERPLWSNEVPAVEPVVEDGIEAREQQALVQRALESVELDRRAILISHDLDDVPVPQIAESLGIPLNTAYSRVRLARMEFAAATKRLRRMGGDR